MPRMPEESATFEDRVLNALEQSDDVRRSARAKRMIDLSPHVKNYGLVVEAMDTSAIRQEAYDCYINGHFVATLMLAVAFIEHTLTDAIVGVGEGRPQSFEQSINTARSLNLFPGELLDKTNRLREIRNPFSHRKPANHPHSFGNRYQARQEHPTKILGADAKEALLVMLKYFDLTA